MCVRLGWGWGLCDSKMELEQISYDVVVWIPLYENEVQVLVYCEHCRRIHVSRNPRDFSNYSGLRY